MTIRSSRAVLLICSSLALLVSSCGGGGGGGDGGGGLSVSTDRVTFAGRSAQAVPPSQTVRITLSGSSGAAFVGAALPDGDPGWISADILPAGANYDLVIGITSTTQFVGVRSTRLTVGTADADGNVLDTRDITVDYTINAVLPLTPASSSAAFVLGSSVSTGSVPVQAGSAGTTWTFTSSAPWLQPAGGENNGVVSAAVPINVTGLAPGAYSATLRVQSTASAAVYGEAVVDINVAVPEFTAPASFTLGGADGLGAETGTLPFSLNTGTTTYAWTATPLPAGPAWLTGTVLSGSVGSAGATASLAANRALVAPGVATGQVRLQATVLGQLVEKVVPVTYNRESHRLLPRAAGVAFSSFPTGQALSRSVTIASGRDVAGIVWEATSNQPWLTVTGAGTTGGELLLTADPGSLAPDQEYRATVTVSSPDARIDRAEDIQVSLWVGSSDPVDVAIPWQAGRVITNPVRPWAYVVGSGAASPDFSDISIFNVHTGAFVANLPTPGFFPTVLAVSGDGRTLYVLDDSPLTVLALDAATGATLASYTPIPAADLLPTDDVDLHYSRPNGHPVVWLSGRPRALDAGSLQPLAGVAPPPGILASTPDQKQLLGVTTLTSSRLAGSSVKYTALGASRLSGTALATSPFLNGGVNDACVTANGATLIATPTGGVSAATVPIANPVEPVPQAFLGDGGSFARAVDCAASGLAIVATGGQLGVGPGRFYFLDNDGLVLGSTPITGNAGDVGSRNLRRSGDLTRIVFDHFIGQTSGDQRLEFRSSPGLP